MVYKRGFRPLRRYKKRWYVDARIGKGVPIIGGTGIVAGSGRRGFQKRSLKQVIKRQALKQSETKEVVTRVVGSALKHNTMYNVKLNNIPQGTAQGQRIGDRVFYCGISLKFYLLPSLGNTYWRFYIVRHRESNVSTDAIHFEGGNPVIGASLMFRNADTSPDALLNTDDVKIVCAKTLKVDQRFTGEANITRNFKLNCKIMSGFQYRTGSQEGEYYNYYLVVLPMSNVVGSQTTGTTSVGTCAVTVEQVFKDA